MNIAKPLTIAATPTAAGTGAANLLTPSPREVWVAPNVGTHPIHIDLGAAQDVDTFFLGFTNATTGATWLIQWGTVLGGGLTTIVPSTPMRAADSLGPRHHAYVKLAAPVNARYFSIWPTQTGADPLYAGVLILSKGFVSPYEFGGGRQPIDTGAKEPLPDGGFGLGDGVVVALLRWKFIDLSPAMRRQLWALVYDRGERKPVLVAEELGEGAAGLGEELHYGLFERFEPYSRDDPGATVWALSMREWA